MSQDRTAVTKTFRWDLVIPHDGFKPYRKPIHCDCHKLDRRGRDLDLIPRHRREVCCGVCAEAPPLPMLRPTEIVERETFSDQCAHVPGCVRVSGHPSFHTTSEAVAKKEDGR